MNYFQREAVNQRSEKELLYKYFNEEDAMIAVLFKGAFSGLRQFFATENPLKLMKNAFNFTSEALFDLKIFKFLS